MQVNFGSGDSGFTLDGMTGMGGDINGASNITIRNSTFTGSLDIGGSNSNIVLDGNQHNWNAAYSGGLNAKLFLGDSGSHTLSSPAVTIKNSEFKNGDLDGIHLGDGSGYLILNNVFDNLCDRGTNHTDNIQFDTHRDHPNPHRRQLRPRPRHQLRDPGNHQLRPRNQRRHHREQRRGRPSSVGHRALLGCQFDRPSQHGRVSPELAVLLQHDRAAGSTSTARVPILRVPERRCTTMWRPSEFNDGFHRHRPPQRLWPNGSRMSVLRAFMTASCLLVARQLAEVPLLTEQMRVYMPTVPDRLLLAGSTLVLRGVETGDPDRRITAEETLVEAPLGRRSGPRRARDARPIGREVEVDHHGQWRHVEQPVTDEADDALGA